MPWIELLAAVVLAAPLPSFADDKPKPAAGWETDYAAARTLARDAGKPMFVVFR